MPTIKVTIGEETHEVDLSAVELPENYDLINPDNASSKGYFTQAQLNAKAKEINKSKVEKAKKDLMEDEEFLQEAANRKWGISFNEEGQPQGLKPEVDVDEVRRKAVENVKKDYDGKLEEVNTKASTYRDRLIEQSILSATKGAWKESYTKPQDDGRVKPIVVNQYKDLWDIDERGQVALRDQDGEGFVVNAKGQHITPDEYLTNKEKFGDYMNDTRQKGSNFQGGGGNNGQTIMSRKDIAKMSDAEYAKHREEIKKAGAEGRVQ